MLGCRPCFGLLCSRYLLVWPAERLQRAHLGLRCHRRLPRPLGHLHALRAKQAEKCLVLTCVFFCLNSAFYTPVASSPPNRKPPQARALIFAAPLKLAAASSLYRGKRARRAQATRSENRSTSRVGLETGYCNRCRTYPEVHRLAQTDARCNGAERATVTAPR